MAVYGLLGYPLEHSGSPRFFETKFREEGLTGHRFDLLEMESLDQLREIIAQKDIRGFSITKPHKTNILPLLDALSPEADAIGAVNSVRVERSNGKLLLKGFNTDVDGLRVSLKGLLPSTSLQALVLGSGGASLAVCYVLKEFGIAHQVVSRNYKPDSLLYEELNEKLMKEHRLIINTTPLGMFPQTQDMPALPYQALGPDHMLFDLIYNPSKTRFLQMGEKHGATILNGLQMLHAQAKASWQIWNAR